jgi:hypothetical protein
VFDTHASDASIAPGVSLGLGTVQKPLDLSMSIFRPCCAEATATNRNITAIRTFVGFILIIWIREMFRGYVGFVRDYLHGLKSP